MPNRLYLVRHAENRANIDNVFSCREIDYALTPKGVLQAQQTAEYFESRNIDRIYTSPLKRAVETAEIIAGHLSLGVEVMDNFREVDVGSLEGLPIKGENLALYKSIVEAWRNGTPETSFPNGEDYRSVWARMQAGLVRILAGKEGRRFIVVGHAALFNAVSKALGQHIETDRAYYNCAVSEFLVGLNDGQLTGTLISWATHAHLHGPAAAFGLH